jgi:hypothetical protein
MEGGTRYDSTHKYWEEAIETVKAHPQYEPSELCDLWDMLDEWDAAEMERRARQAAGLEPPDNYCMIKEQPPPGFADPEEVQRVAKELCQMLEESVNDEWRQLGELIRAKILGNGRPAHRPPSADIAARNARIVEQVEYWLKKAQPKRPKKVIYHDVGRPYGLSARSVKEIAANATSATKGHGSPT